MHKYPGHASESRPVCQTLIQSLGTRNQTSSDLLINSFKVYGALSDYHVFQELLLRKQGDDREEGNKLSADNRQTDAHSQ